MRQEFDEFDSRECIRTNIKVVFMFFVVIIAPILIDTVVYKLILGYVKQTNNGFGDLIVILIFLFLQIAILIMYSVIVTAKVRIYKELGQNVKSLIGLFICNIIIAIFLYVTVSQSIGYIYFGTVIVLCSVTLSIRYYIRNYNFLQK